MTDEAIGSADEADDVEATVQPGKTTTSDGAGRIYPDQQNPQNASTLLLYSEVSSHFRTKTSLEQRSEPPRIDFIQSVN